MIQVRVPPLTCSPLLPLPLEAELHKVPILLAKLTAKNNSLGSWLWLLRLALVLFGLGSVCFVAGLGGALSLFLLGSVQVGILGG